jgi:hypothetical protein
MKKVVTSGIAERTAQNKIPDTGETYCEDEYYSIRTFQTRAHLKVYLANLTDFLS